MAEYLSWYIEHPSPLATGLFGRELTRPELVAKAVESAALSFKGTGWKSGTPARPRRAAAGPT